MQQTGRIHFRVQGYKNNNQESKSTRVTLHTRKKRHCRSFVSNETGQLGTYGKGTKSRSFTENELIEALQELKVGKVPDHDAEFQSQV